MEWFALLLPLVILVVSKVLFPHKITAFEAIAPMAVIFLLILLLKFAFFSYSTYDIQYKDCYVVSVDYYEEWDEWIQKTCQRQIKDSKGNVVSVQYYDCSYRSYHAPEYIANLSNGSSINVGEDYWRKVQAKWNNVQFKDLNRDYYRIDGDKYSVSWTNDLALLERYTYQFNYENRLQCNSSLFSKVETEESENSFDYPSFKSAFNYPSVIGSGPQINQANIELSNFNAINNLRLNCRVWLLVFDEGNINDGYLQEKHWQGGNQNELVFCIGLSDSKPKWIYSFCWSPDGYAGNEVIKINVRNWFLRQDSIDLVDLVNQITSNMTRWKAKPLEELEYIPVYLSGSQLFFIYFVAIVSSVISIVIGINNKWNHLDELAFLMNIWNKIKKKFKGFF